MGQIHLLLKHFDILDRSSFSGVACSLFTRSLAKIWRVGFIFGGLILSRLLTKYLQSYLSCIPASALHDNNFFLYSASCQHRILWMRTNLLRPPLWSRNGWTSPCPGWPAMGLLQQVGERVSMRQHHQGWAYNQIFRPIGNFANRQGFWGVSSQAVS